MSNKKREILRWLSGLAVVVLLVVPTVYYRSLEQIKNVGYIGYFVANYFGYGLYILPFLVTKLNPILLILIGAFGSTIDEFFAWYFGRTTEKLEKKSRLHEKVEYYIAKYGLSAVFFMGVLPMPGFILTIAGFAGGHYGIPYLKYFLAGFGGRLISRTLWTLGFLYAAKRVTWF